MLDEWGHFLDGSIKNYISYGRTHIDIILGSVADPKPNPDPPHWLARFGSGSRKGQKWPTKIEKVKKFCVWNCWMFSLRAEGFSCRSDVLRIKKLQVFIFKKFCYFSVSKPYKFWPSECWIRIRIRISLMETDPHWNQYGSTTLILGIHHCNIEDVLIIQYLYP